MGNAWILASADNESGTVNNYWDGDEWQATLNNALPFTDAAGITVEGMRRTQGDFQQRFDDRDVRMIRVSVTLATV